jgi:hypothetical protein
MARFLTALKGGDLKTAAPDSPHPGVGLSMSCNFYRLAKAEVPISSDLEKSQNITVSLCPF